MRDGIDVEVREVGLRDGIQGIRTFFPTEGKRAWIAAEARAGVPEIEACSLVPAKLFPQFVDAEEAIAEALRQPGLCVSALVPNLRGAERGFALGVHKLNFVLSVSLSHNQANVRRTPEESLEQFRLVAEARDEAARNGGRRVLLSGALATSFGCSIEGPIAENDVLELAAGYVEAGADEVTLADTVGYANPAQVKRLFERAALVVGDVPLAAHFHDTRGLGLANVHAALEAGVRRFDASLTGLGGCPAAPGATGNIVMEDLVFMLEAMGLRTGVDLDALLAIREIVRTNLPDELLHGRIPRAGKPKGFRPASRPVHAAAE
jgi:hydroxymethylglutaryl-CoA lyase